MEKPMVMQGPIKVATATVDIEPDTTRLRQVMRVIAKHAAALADDLDALGAGPMIQFSPDWTEEQIAQFKKDWSERVHDAPVWLGGSGPDAGAAPECP